MVTNERTLRALAKAGFILWEPYRERHWTGLWVKRKHVRRGPNFPPDNTFKLHGREYYLRYVDGCFYPFVFRVGEQVPSFV